MVEGYLLDLGDGSRRRPQQWIEGPPKKSFWHGLDIKNDQRHTVIAFRCPRCGLLLEYAL
jgi:hypothetical protein